MKKYIGNMNLWEHGFKTDRDEPCTAQISVRIPPSLKQKLKTTKNWQELVRQTLIAAVEAEEELKAKS